MLNRRMVELLMGGLLMGVFCQTGYALDSDSEQPTTLNADEFEIDLNTGVRIYRGNVVFRQGSIKLTCDELTTYLNDDAELDRGICIGSPGIFIQRPEDSEVDIVGSAMEITMDEIENLVTLKSQAKVVQGGLTITGPIITYNKLTKKASVKGGGSQGIKAMTETADGEQSSDPTSGESTPGKSTVAEQASSESTRSSLTIQPRKKKTNE
ncbi:lipopolysaccharide transport periplasmic protein LptA [Candidatus Spongiihabitans sp.]|uniref:lipopolysaccharide transport periplasmic protein LptA n=1 Tax=Candidatus Spongiihabitans sp. TaxID=3101308 RepID=UPI003C6F6408